MRGLKTVLFYILGLAGLILASVMFTGPGEVEVGEFVPATPAGQTTREEFEVTAARPTGADQSDCAVKAMSINYSYQPDAPLTTTLISPDLTGERLIISGTVYASDRVTPLPAARIEVWQADAGGRYGHLRAQMQTDAGGRYHFATIKPGHYKVDCRPMPAHIHYRVSYLDNKPLFLTLFVADDPYLTNLPVEPASIRSLVTRAGVDGPVLHAMFDIVLPVNVGGEG